ncbi:MAG: protein phosphatase 2C domain-containing protein, partial [Pseudomonadota bacterium]
QQPYVTEQAREHLGLAEQQTIEWQSAAKTHRGNVREYNEDAYLAHPESGVWAVADGMGGHHAGDVASREVVAALAKVSFSDNLAGLQAACRSQLDAVNHALFEQGLQRQAQIIGSTVVAMVASGADAAMLWAGDSRGYRLRGNELTQVTRDHSRTNELIEQGILKPEAAEQHPEANVITRAVGVARQLPLDETSFTVATDDVYLLCSDGLTRYVPEPELHRCLSMPTCNAAAEELMRLALATDARDNISIVVMRAQPADDSTTVFNFDVAGDTTDTEDRTLLNLDDN